jgi:type II secretory ATPase GspE/PulE/Tfp pilus assembly ATPase PilB-like protein
MPQDGRLVAEIGGARIDMRVSTLPVTRRREGRDARRRHEARNVELDQLGMCDRDLSRVLGFLERPQGIVLVTGPTGSGKTTLLYAALQQVRTSRATSPRSRTRSSSRSPGLNQVQVDEKAKKSFAVALRAILRQDPDVIMIGEIRDRETAQIAFRASVTGHLVLSTVHTNDAAGAVTRLVDLGLEPFMVASALVGVVSIRLVRVICPKCKESYEADARRCRRIGGTWARRHVTLYRGAGCPTCRQAGLHGPHRHLRGARAWTTPCAPHRARRVRGRDARHRRQGGMRPIGEDGLDKTMRGITTLDEVTRVVYLPSRA